MSDNIDHYSIIDTMKIDEMDALDIMEMCPDILMHPKDHIEELVIYILSEADTISGLKYRYHDMMCALAVYICANKPKPKFLYRYILFLSDILKQYVSSDYILNAMVDSQREEFKDYMKNRTIDGIGQFYYPDKNPDEFEKLKSCDFDELNRIKS